MIIYELTEDENLCLEAVQERGIVYASDVRDYLWNEYGKNWTKEKATRQLCKLAKQSIVRRLPRTSAGWGQGWYPSAYQLAKQVGGATD